MLPLFLGDVKDLIVHSSKFLYHSINFLRSFEEAPAKEVIRHPPGSLWYC